MNTRKDTFLSIATYVGTALLCGVVTVSWFDGGPELAVFVYVLNGVIFPAGMFAEGYSEFRLRTFVIACLLGPFTLVLVHYNESYRDALIGIHRTR